MQMIRRGTGREPAFALNTALDLARGDFAGLVAAGDRLHPMALLSLVARLQGERRPALVYGDEDVIGQAGAEAVQHREPMFKPDWSPELLLGLDYTCRGSVVRRGCCVTWAVSGRASTGRATTTWRYACFHCWSISVWSMSRTRCITGWACKDRRRCRRAKAATTGCTGP